MGLGPRITTRNCTFIGVGTAYKLTGDVVLDSEGDRFENVGTAYDVQDRPEVAIPGELLREVVGRLTDLERETGKRPSERDAEDAGRKSGLTRWLADQSVNIVNLGAQLLAMYLQYGPK